MRGRGDGEATRVAEAQRGCVHRAQLLAAGLTAHAIRHRLATHRLHSVHRDVYLWGRPRIEPLGLETAAVLHFAGHAVLSHRTAGWMWGLIDEAPDEVEVTCGGRDGHGKHGLRVHRRPLGAREIGLRQGLPVTSAARTLVDLAGVLRAVELESALAIAVHDGLAAPGEIADALALAPRAKGTGVLRELLHASTAGRRNGVARTRSRYERRLLELIREAGLPRPLANERVDGLEVDLLWPAERVVVEFDGFAFHRGRRAFERDRGRDRRLARLGYQVVRVTARGIDSTPLQTVADLATIIALRGAR